MTHAYNRHQRWRVQRYYVSITLTDEAGQQQARFDLQRVGADSLGTLCAHHAWASSQSGLHIELHITDREPRPWGGDPHTSGELPAL